MRSLKQFHPFLIWTLVGLEVSNRPVRMGLLIWVGRMSQDQLRDIYSKQILRKGQGRPTLSWPAAHEELLASGSCSRSRTVKKEVALMYYALCSFFSILCVNQ